MSRRTVGLGLLMAAVALVAWAWATTWTATGGTITSGGTYTAGQTPGHYVVVATAADGRADTAEVTITAPPSGVSAGPDVAGRVGQPIALTGSAPAGRLVFWTAVSGPGDVRFGHPMFHEGFESGTIGTWSSDGGGEQTPGTASFVTTDRAHGGTHSWAAYNDPAIADPVIRFSAKLLRWRFDRAQGFYSAWYYWPAAYNVASAPASDQYVNIFQFKQDGAPFDPTWIIAAKAYGGVDQFGMHTYAGADIIPTGVSIPKDQWFNLTCYLTTSSTAGRVAVWLTTAGSTRKIFDRTGLNTTSGATTLMWGVGNYGKAGIGPGKFPYIDDTDVSDATTDARQTTATMSAPGTYTLRLAADDGTAVTTDEVTVTVAP